MIGAARAHAAFDSIPAGRTRLERTVAWVRAAVVAGIIIVLVVPPRDEPYGAVAGWLAGVAALYAAVSLWRVHMASAADGTSVRAARVFAGTDGLLVALIVAASGGTESFALPVALLVGIETAIRFSPREAFVLTGMLAVLLATIILLVPRPPLGLDARLEGMIWWVGLLVWGTIMVASLARLLLDEQRERTLIEAEHRSERHELARERRLRHRLEEIEEERREFLHVLHHELRTPISSIEALSRAASRRDELDPVDWSQIIHLLQGHAHHVGALLEELRTVVDSGIAGRTSGISTDVVIADVVQSATNAASLPVEAMRVTVAPEAAVVRLQEDKVRRVLTNLFENARRHSPDGEPIELDVTVAGEQFLLVVRDSGPGVADEQAASMFDKFVGGGERGGTSGLGLWIVSELVRSMGGSVHASNRPHGGLEVRVALPVSMATPHGAGDAGVTVPAR